MNGHAYADSHGERLGEYELREVIVSATNCDVYLAMDRATGQTVEITLLSERGLAAPGVVQRLVRAANLARQLDHSALARVIALDADAGGNPFVVEEHVRGEPLSKQLDAAPAGMPLERVLGMLTPIVEAVAHCHRVGLVHGRIDRHHIVLTGGNGGPAKLIRFGVDDESRSRTVAPELRTAGRPADARSDVWALAALLHEMLAGTAAAADSGAVKLAAHPARPPEALVAMLVRCLAVAPEARPQDASTLRDALLGLRHKPAPTPLRVASQDTAPNAGLALGSVVFDPIVVSAVTQKAAAPVAPTQPGVAATGAIVSLGPGSIVDPEPRPASTKRTLTEFSTRRARRRRRPLTDPAFSSRALRGRKLAGKSTVIGHAASDEASPSPATAGTTTMAALDRISPLASAAPNAIEAVETSAALGPAEHAAYQLPHRTFLDLKAKPGGAAAAAHVTPQAAAAVAPPAGIERAAHAAPEVAAAIAPPAGIERAAQAAGQVATAAIGPTAAIEPVAAGAQATAATPRAEPELRPARAPAARSKRPRVRVKPLGPVRSLRAKVGATAGKARGGRQSMAASVRQRAARSLRASSRSMPQQAVRTVGLANRVGEAPGLDHGAHSRPLAPGPLELRPRLGSQDASATEAIARAGEDHARSELRGELFTLLLCTLIFAGVPLLCDPTHARAEQLLGGRVRLGHAILAASAVTAVLRLWWLQSSTRHAALWPATIALKAVTLLICFLTATDFVPAGVFGTLEVTARSLLPWAAGAFYLALGVSGLLRTRYNTAQHGALGVLLAVLYGGSVVGSFRVVHAGVRAQQEGFQREAARRDALASSMRDRARDKRPSARLGAADSTNLEAELEALGDTSGQAPAGAPPTRDGAEQDELRDSERLRGNRDGRAERLEALHKELKSLK